MTFSADRVHRGATCDVAQVYKSTEPPAGAAVLTLLGEVEDIELLLVPAKLDPGSYSISVTRKGSNLYRVDGMGTYIKTKYCYEYAYSEDAVLKYQSTVGPIRGSLVFAN